MVGSAQQTLKRLLAQRRQYPPRDTHRIEDAQGRIE
jgi:hypothetical protein